MRRTARFRSSSGRPAGLVPDDGLVGGSYLTLKMINKAIRGLHEGMSQVMLLLTDQRAERVWEVSVALCEAWPQWRADPGTVPVIEVKGDDEGFPFELLPLLSISAIDDEFANLAEAEDALLGFLGFGACIRRTLGEEVLGDLAAGPRIPVQVFLYDDLTGARMEVADVFGGLDDVTIDGPWPHDGMDTTTVKRRLIDALFDPAKDLTGTPTGATPVQIQHFWPANAIRRARPAPVTC